MATIAKGRIFAKQPVDRESESFDDLLSEGGIRIERIVSLGHASPPGFWYDQDSSEWVLLLRGAARLEFKEPPQTVDLEPGDYVDIPAGVRHRVAWTDPDQPTVWLAVWYQGNA